MRFTTIIVLTLLLTIGLQAKKKGAPAMASGAPGDRTCNSGKCHAGNDLNSEKANKIRFSVLCVRQCGLCCS